MRKIKKVKVKDLLIGTIDSKGNETKNYMNKSQPKTQGKIEDYLIKIFMYDNPQVLDDDLFDEFEVWLEGSDVTDILTHAEIALIQEQQAQLQRVIELIGEDDPSGDKTLSLKERNFYGARNSLRKDLKSKISQMGEEYGV